MVGQKAIVNRLLWMQNHYSLTGEDVVAQKTPCSFDVSLINRLKGMLIFDAETDFVRPGIIVRRSGPDVPAYADAAQLCALSAFITIAVVLYMSVRFNE